MCHTTQVALNIFGTSARKSWLGLRGRHAEQGCNHTVVLRTLDGALAIGGRGAGLVAAVDNAHGLHEAARVVLRHGLVAALLACGHDAVQLLWRALAAVVLRCHPEPQRCRPSNLAVAFY